MTVGELTTEGRVLVPRCKLADGFFTRFLGLMGRSGLPADEGMLFPRCNSIHTFFMRFPIDVLYLDPKGQVVEVFESLRPWRLLLPRKGVRHVVELPPRRSRELQVTVGTRLQYPGVFE